MGHAGRDDQRINLSHMLKLCRGEHVVKPEARTIGKFQRVINPQDRIAIICADIASRLQFYRLAIIVKRPIQREITRLINPLRCIGVVR